MKNDSPPLRRGIFDSINLSSSLDMMSCKAITILCAFAVAGCLLAGCSANDADTIRLGYLQNDLHHLPAFVALEKKLFEREGLNVQVAGIFRAGPEEMSAFAADALDVGYVGQAPATAAYCNGVADIRFVSQVNLEGSALVVGRTSKIFAPADLRGKTIAIPGHATMQDFLLRKALRRHHVAADRVKLIVLKPPEMLQALGLAEIDAFIAWEPYPAAALASGVGRILLTSSQIWSAHPCCVLVARTAFCEQFPEKLNSIKKVHDRACRYIIENPEEAVRVGTLYTGMDRATVARALKQIVYRTALDRQKEREFVDFLRNLKYIKQKTSARSIDSVFYD
ncbi:ABC transporter substrate-binding protein [Thermodesulfobacteriota bacterium]